MKQQISTNDGELIFEGDFETFGRAVEAALNKWVSLKNANLMGANLPSANLSGADFSGATLVRANLMGANLSGVNLSGANLSGAYLEEANLSGASLEEANLSGANLSRVNLSEAYLSGANLTGAKGVYLFNKPNGRTCHAVEHGNCLMIQAGCFWGTLDEFEAQCKEKYPDNSVEAYSSQIKYLRTLSEELYK